MPMLYKNYKKWSQNVKKLKMQNKISIFWIKGTWNDFLGMTASSILYCIKGKKAGK